MLVAVAFGTAVVGAQPAQASGMPSAELTITCDEGDPVLGTNVSVTWSLVAATESADPDATQSEFTVGHEGATDSLHATSIPFGEEEYRWDSFSPDRFEAGTVINVLGLTSGGPVTLASAVWPTDCGTTSPPPTAPLVGEIEISTSCDAGVDAPVSNPNDVAIRLEAFLNSQLVATSDFGPGSNGGYSSPASALEIGDTVEVRLVDIESGNIIASESITYGDDCPQPPVEPEVTLWVECAENDFFHMHGSVTAGQDVMFAVVTDGNLSFTGEIVDAGETFVFNMTVRLVPGNTITIRDMLHPDQPTLVSAVVPAACPEPVDPPVVYPVATFSTECAGADVHVQWSITAGSNDEIFYFEHAGQRSPTPSIAAGDTLSHEATDEFALYPAGTLVDIVRDDGTVLASAFWPQECDETPPPTTLPPVVVDPAATLSIECLVDSDYEITFSIEAGSEDADYILRVRDGNGKLTDGTVAAEGDYSEAVTATLDEAAIVVLRINGERVKSAMVPAACPEPVDPPTTTVPPVEPPTTTVPPVEPPTTTVPPVEPPAPEPQPEPTPAPQPEPEVHDDAPAELPRTGPGSPTLLWLSLSFLAAGVGLVAGGRRERSRM